MKAVFNVSDQRLRDVAKRPADGSPVIIQMDYGKPATARSITYATKCNLKALVIASQMPTSWADDALGQGMKPIPPLGELEASDDAKVWRPVCPLPGTGYQQDSWVQQTVAFPAATARYFRMKINVTTDTLKLVDVALHGEARIDQWEKKSGERGRFFLPRSHAKLFS